MADLEKIKADLMALTDEELKKIAEEKGRKAQCAVCGKVAYSVDTVVIYCPHCNTRVELEATF